MTTLQVTNNHAVRQRGLCLPELCQTRSSTRPIYADGTEGAGARPSCVWSGAHAENGAATRLLMSSDQSSLQGRARQRERLPQSRRVDAPVSARRHYRHAG